ncbi:hypothetical protein Hamer_G007410 [Homarus americanus]|uniref:Uncharacterized protein n=1 Tax=Homarus americanus TaxID=6706 RepID=A0A8J5MSI3_HOMAM|nr:hypothetical protein Hamer_G007410 [Homarus americanus]
MDKGRLPCGVSSPQGHVKRSLMGGPSLTFYTCRVSTEPQYKSRHRNIKENPFVSFHHMRWNHDPHTANFVWKCTATVTLSLETTVTLEPRCIDIGGTNRAGVVLLWLVLTATEATLSQLGNLYIVTPVHYETDPHAAYRFNNVIT